MQSMVPSSSPFIMASRSSSDRRGGLTLKFGLKLSTSSSVREMWCGVASAVMFIPRAFALRMISTAVPELMCWRWMWAPVLDAKMTLRETTMSSAAFGTPRSPSLVDTNPSFITLPSDRA